MPDHVHFIAAPSSESAKSLSGYMQGWKQWTSKRIGRECQIEAPIWQHGFNDLLLRSEDFADRRKDYIFLNAVRAGLVRKPEEWPWQGIITSKELR